MPHGVAVDSRYRYDAASHLGLTFASTRATSSPVYTIQPVVKPVECLYTRYNRLSNRLYNRFDNRLYRVNGIGLLIIFYYTGCVGSPFNHKKLAICSIFILPDNVYCFVVASHVVAKIAHCRFSTWAFTQFAATTQRQTETETES